MSLADDLQNRMNHENTAMAAGAMYLRISTDTPVEDVVLGSLREKRVLE